MVFEIGHGLGYLGRMSRGVFAPNRSPWHAAVGAVGPSALGIPSDHGYWTQVFKAYQEDEVGVAIALAGNLGEGGQGEYAPFTAVLAAEAASTADTQIFAVTDEIEVETTGIDDDLFTSIREARDRVWSILAPGVPRRPALVTFLSQGSYLPFPTMREGYFAPKMEYGKICLPSELWATSEALAVALRAQFASQVVWETTHANADLWVYESATSFVDADRSGPIREYLAPQELSHALMEESDEDDGLARLSSALAQASKIGRFLLLQFGEKAFSEFLAAHVPKGFFGSLRESRADKPLTPEAAQKVYSLSDTEIFERARH